MAPKLTTAALFLGLTLPHIAAADLQVAFIEGAPKDRFRIENAGGCPISNGAITLDLAGSQGRLIFDTTGQGAGVEVFQPFDLVEGANRLAALPQVTDGQSEIRLEVAQLAPGERITFTIDVDDTIGQREITVSGSEIAGAMVHLTQGSAQNSAPFSTRARASVAMGDCGTAS